LSYDIEMLRLSGPDDLLTQAHRARDAAIQRDQRGLEQTSSREEEEGRAKLAADLVALHPSLYTAPFDKGMSHGCVVTTDGSDCGIPYIEIGVDSAIVTFPYSADFESLLPGLKRVIEVFERHGYTAYDRQTDTIVSSSASFQESGLSFAATRDEAVEQMLARGETVVGLPTRRRPSWTTTGLVILVVAVAVVLIQRHYASQRPPSVTKELHDLQDRIKRMTSAPPGPTTESEATKNRVRSSQ
jgi:hypothetical protein